MSARGVGVNPKADSVREISLKCRLRQGLKKSHAVGDVIYGCSLTCFATSANHISPSDGRTEVSSFAEQQRNVIQMDDCAADSPSDLVSGILLLGLVMYVYIQPGLSKELNHHQT